MVGVRCAAHAKAQPHARFDRALSSGLERRGNDAAVRATSMVGQLAAKSHAI
jgi:hypothetical protein